MPAGRSMFVSEFENQITRAETEAEARNVGKEIGRNGHLSEKEREALMGLVRIKIAETGQQAITGKGSGVVEAPSSLAPPPAPQTRANININITLMAEGGKHAAYLTREVIRMLGSASFWVEVGDK